MGIIKDSNEGPILPLPGSSLLRLGSEIHMMRSITYEFPINYSLRQFDPIKINQRVASSNGLSTKEGHERSNQEVKGQDENENTESYPLKMRTQEKRSEKAIRRQINDCKNE